MLKPTEFRLLTSKTVRNKSLSGIQSGILLWQLSGANPRVQEKCYSVPLCLHLYSTSSSMWMMCFLSSHKDAIYTGLGFHTNSACFDSVPVHSLSHV